MWRGLLKGGILLAVIVFVAAFKVSGQRKLNFRTVEFGAGPALVSFHDNDPRVNHTAKPSFAASGGFTYALKRNLFFATHAMYEHKGGKAVEHSRNVEDPPIAYNTTSSYITSAVGVRQYLADGGIFVEAGPFVAFLLGSTTTRTANGASARINKQFASVDVGGSFSVGYTPARARYSGLSIRLVNNLGMTDIDLTTGRKEWTNSLALIMGMRIQMN